MENADTGTDQAVTIFDGGDAEYQDWLAVNRTAYVLNTPRHKPPRYMVVHRSTCRLISRYRANAPRGAFTERQYIKVCASSIARLRAWLKENGRRDGTFSKACSVCRPL